MRCKIPGRGLTGVARVSLMLAVWLLAALSAGAQTIADDFSDGSLAANPAWGGTPERFIHQQGTLRLNGPESATNAYISTHFSRNLISNATEWQLWLRLDCLLQSGRRIRWALTSDRANLSQTFVGYYIELGRPGSLGRVELFVETGSGPSLVAASQPGCTDAFPTLRIRVRRSSGFSGTWELAVDPTGGRDFAVEATVPDGQLLASEFTGLSINYTPSAREHIAIDDYAAGTPPADVTGPVLARAQAVSATEVRATFSETVNASQLPGNYSIAGVGMAVTATRDLSNRAAVRLQFGAALPLGMPVTLTATGVRDVAGNTGGGSVPFTWWDPIVPTAGSLRITEVMPDPTPPIGLPDAEYIEIENRSTRAIDLSGTALANTSARVASERLPLPAEVLPAGGRLLLVPTPRLIAFGPQARGIPMPNPWLNNGGDSVSLFRGALLIDQAVFGAAPAGRSLERSLPDAACLDVRLWRPSTAPMGGTPGAPNSAAAADDDRSPPQLLRWAAVGASAVQLLFDGPLDSASATSNVNYRLKYPSGESLPPVLATLVAANRIQLLLPLPLDTAQTTVLSISGIADCFGNVLTEAIELRLARLRPPQPGELRLNELLAHPAVGGVRYVELIASSTAALDLAGCRLQRDRGRVSVLLSPATEPLPLLPQQVVALTEDPEDVRARFTPPPTAYIVATPAIPAIADPSDAAGDELLLLGPDSTVLDQLNYQPGLHSRLLNDLRGVALERTDPAQNNWHSAAGPCYGTPGFTNSRSSPTDDLGIRLSSETFSPDADGRDDVLRISLSGGPADALLTLEVADIHGRIVRSLARRLLMPSAGELEWDGQDAQGALLAPGVYLLVARLSTGGRERLQRIPCVLARQP